MRNILWNRPTFGRHRIVQILWRWRHLSRRKWLLNVFSFHLMLLLLFLSSGFATAAGAAAAGVASTASCAATTATATAVAAGTGSTGPILQQLLH